MASTRDAAIRVAVVDDDAISRAGMVKLLDEAGMQVVLDCTHDEAMSSFGESEGIDVLLVDAADDRNVGDHFPGVRVVMALRSLPQHRDTTVIAVTGHRLEGGLSLRMREVGADLMMDRREIRDDGALIDVVRNPGSARREVEVVDRARMEMLGITPSSNLQALVDEVEMAGLAGLLDDEQVATGAPGRRSREWWRIRERVARAGGIQPRNTDGSHPHRDQDVPSLGQLRRVYAYALRIKDRRPSG